MQLFKIIWILLLLFSIERSNTRKYFPRYILKHKEIFFSTNTSIQNNMDFAIFIFQN